MNESYSVQVLIKFWDSIPKTFILTILLGLYSQKNKLCILNIFLHEMKTPSLTIFYCYKQHFS